MEHTTKACRGAARVAATGRTMDRHGLLRGYPVFFTDDWIDRIAVWQLWEKKRREQREAEAAAAGRGTGRLKRLYRNYSICLQGRKGRIPDRLNNKIGHMLQKAISLCQRKWA